MSNDINDRCLNGNWAIPILFPYWKKARLNEAIWLLNPYIVNELYNRIGKNNTLSPNDLVALNDKLNQRETAPLFELSDLIVDNSNHVLVTHAWYSNPMLNDLYDNILLLKQIVGWDNLILDSKWLRVTDEWSELIGDVRCVVWFYHHINTLLEIDSIGSIICSLIASKYSRAIIEWNNNYTSLDSYIAKYFRDLISSKNIKDNYSFFIELIDEIYDHLATIYTDINQNAAIAWIRESITKIFQNKSNIDSFETFHLWRTEDNLQETSFTSFRQNNNVLWLYALTSLPKKLDHHPKIFMNNWQTIYIYFWSKTSARYRWNKYTTFLILQDIQKGKDTFIVNKNLEINLSAFEKPNHWKKSKKNMLNITIDNIKGAVNILKNHSYFSSYFEFQYDWSWWIITIIRKF